ncbi:class I SAM-dependent methyltransferase [Longimicrobium sp.]|uniref:class I SAM-dependent DNA methyltransferase n=1 Tax=Longimicrobium sp. TaxID=2029185 RepID=UPI002B69A0D6|nr:class I SAM-dependent methyltransferase [Longimicrobium sp.]HSU13788.1 class I SAM-dependent methyltransferase [Longimicrobium sp.]
MFSESAELYDLIYSFKDYPAEAARVRELVMAAGGPGEGTLLDVACGTGMHLRSLRAHYAAEGTDLDEGLLAIARERLPDVPLHRADMRDFDLGRRFGVVTCLFSAIGYVRTPDGLRAAIGCMARHLEPGGALAVEPWFTPDAISDGFVGVNTQTLPDLTVVRMSHTRIEGTVSAIDFEYLVGRPSGITRAAERHEMGLFTRGEMRAAFEAAGLRTTFDEQGITGRGMWVGIREM